MERLYIEYQGDSIELPRGETVVGRDVGCALRFNDPSVSRRHLRFIRRMDDAFVEDLGSSNGTLLNGRPITRPMRVKDGDVLQIGSRTIAVHSVSEDEQAPQTLILGESDDPTLADDATAAPPPGISSRVTMPIVRVPSAVTAPPPFARAQSEPSTPIDRRRHDRVAMELRLVYVSDELEIEATTLDLSHSGVFVCTQILDPVATRCRLTLLIDGGPPLQLDGVVRRVVAHNDRGEPVGLGVELVGLGPAERAWIDVAMKQMAPE